MSRCTVHIWVYWNMGYDMVWPCITYYHHLCKEHMINSWSTSKFSRTPFIIFSENPISDIDIDIFTHDHMDHFVAAHTSRKCDHCTSTSYVDDCWKWFSWWTRQKQGNLDVLSIKKVQYFHGPGSKSLKFHSCPQQVQPFDEVQKRQTKPGWSERQLPKMPLGDLISADVHLAVFFNHEVIPDSRCYVTQPQRKTPKWRVIQYWNLVSGEEFDILTLRGMIVGA